MITIVRDDVTKNVQHPAAQARDYMWRVSDAFQASPLGSRLRHIDGPRQGNLLFPLAYGSALSNITRSQAHQHFGSNLDAIFPPPRTLFRDEIIQLEQETPAFIGSRLRQFFDPWWNFGGFTDSQIKAIRAILHPEAIIAEPLPAQDQDPLDLLKILDVRQEQRALEIGSGHRVIYGVAGSGKTILLVARARFLAEQRPQTAVLLLCYNKCLSAKLKFIRVTTFHKLAPKFGVVRDNDRELGADRLPLFLGGSKSQLER